MLEVINLTFINKHLSIPTTIDGVKEVLIKVGFTVYV